MNTRFSTEEESIEIVNEDSLHHYRTEIPNIIFEMNLDPYEFKAYCILKRTAGDRGACFKTTETLCKEIGCQKPKYSEIKQNLASLGLIIIQKRKHLNGGNMPDLITITDIWPSNMIEMSKKYPKKGGGNPKLPEGVIVDYQGGNLRLPKEELKQEEQKKQQQSTLSKNEHNVNYKTTAAVNLKKSINKTLENSQTPSLNSKQLKIYKNLEDIDIPKEDKIEVTQRYSEDVVKNAIDWAIHPQTKLNKGLAPAIKWACQKRPSIPKSPIDDFKENMEYAKKQEFCSFKGIKVEALSKFVEIDFGTAYKTPIVIRYDEKAFREQLNSALLKVNLNPRI